MTDNSVFEFITTNRNMCDLLVELTRSTINSPRNVELLDPYPPFFLENQIDVTRGTIAKLDMDVTKYGHYVKNKQFDRIKAVFKHNNFETIFNNISDTPSDILIKNRYGNDFYYLLRFILKSCKLEISYDNSIGDIKIFNVKNTFIDENIFHEKVRLADNKSGYLFHGSKDDCWHSIFRNGLKKVSNTSFMTAGAVYGAGIYMSNRYEFSLGYTSGSEKSIVAVYEVVNDPTTYEKTTCIYVIPGGESCILRHLIVGKSSNQKIYNAINMKFHGKTEEILIMNAKMSEKGLKRLERELRDIRKTNVFNVELIDGQLNNWLVSNDKATLHIIFPALYPFDPPFIYVKSPYFTSDSKYITSDGALCYEYLTPSGWQIAMCMENVLLQIFTFIINPGTIEHAGVYTYLDAKTSYEKLAVGQGWNN